MQASQMQKIFWTCVPLTAWRDAAAFSDRSSSLTLLFSEGTAIVYQARKNHKKYEKNIKRIFRRTDLRRNASGGTQRTAEF